MSWLPGITSPFAAWLFALLVPLIVVYFLKLKRTRVEIPSLALWLSVMEDQRVNSPFQKFRRNVLLLLQAAALCLLALAAMQPFVRGTAERAEYLPILIDCSASMAATDAAGKTRLDLAKAEVREIIDNLLPDQRLTLIAVSDTARRVTEFTNNQRVLIDALDQIAVADVPTQLEDGLQLAQALARSYPIQTVRFYSDLNLPTQVDELGQQADSPAAPTASVDFDLPFDFQFFRVDEAGPNIGVTALNARRTGAEDWDVFVRIEGSPNRQTAGLVELLANGAPVAQEQVLIERGASQRLGFDYTTADRVDLEVRLTPDGEDSLAADNAAFLELPAGRPLSVYCPLNLPAYRHSLAALDGVELLPTDERDPQRAKYDLVISAERKPTELDAHTYLLTGFVPDDLTGLVTIETGLAEVVDWKREDELLQHVMFQDVEITDQPKVAAGVETGDFEELGYEVLVQGDGGPLMLRRRDGPVVTVSLLFHTDRSTLPYRVGFPVLVANVVRLALQQAELSDVRAVATGVLPPLSVDADRSFEVKTPSGDRIAGSSDAEGVLKGIAARTVGVYEVVDSGQVDRRVGANLLSSTETSLVGVDRIHFRELSVGEQDGQISIDRPLWSYFAVAAFLFLLAEWWLYLRRPGGVPG